jgi:anti-anti-sigma factor
MIDRRMLRPPGDRENVTAADFATDVDIENGVHVVTVSGELDVSTAPELKAKLDEAVEEARAVLVDLERCEFIDSTGLATLVGARSRLGQRDASLAICGAGPQVRRLLDLTGAADDLGLQEDRAAAFAALA